MATTQKPTSFLDLPLEIRIIIYDLAIETQHHHYNALNSRETCHTPEKLPLFHVHQAIAADLQRHVYGDDFSIVLPIQEPGDMLLGKGHNSGSIQPYIQKLPSVLKQRTRKLVIEMAQPCPDVDGKEDVGFWYRYDNLAPYLAPVILESKKAIPSLEGVHLIFWYEYCHATVQNWQSDLEKLAEDWIAIERNQKDTMAVCEDKTTDKFNPKVSHVQAEDDWHNPAEVIGFNVYREDLDPNFNASGMLKPKFFLKVQFNLFDFSDPDAGDGGWNAVQGWDSYADRTLKNDSTLQLEFVAKDLKYEEHVQGIFEGRQFNPKGWAHEEINLMDERDRDAMLHTRCVSKDICQPLYVKTVREV